MKIRTLPTDKLYTKKQKSVNSNMNAVIISYLKAIFEQEVDRKMNHMVQSSIPQQKKPKILTN
jgi:hypothetical protein